MKWLSHNHVAVSAKGVIHKMVDDGLINQAGLNKGLQDLNLSGASITPTDSPFAFTLENLKQSRMYWKGISRTDAKEQLQHSDPGTFLIRDSENLSHFFTLSLKSSSKVLNIRILYYKGKFTLETGRPTTEPYFECVVKMIEYYVKLTKDGYHINLASARGHVVKVKLIKPLWRSCPSLRHICRVQLNRQDLKRISRVGGLPVEVKQYLQQYPYKI